MPGPAQLATAAELRLSQRGVALPIAREVRGRLAPDAALVELPDEALERRAGVCHDPERDRTRRTDVTFVDVDLDDLLGRRVAPVFVEGQIEIPESRADDEHHVGIATHQIARLAEAEHEVSVVAGHRRAARHAGEHGTAESLHQAEQDFVGAGTVDTRAGDHGRTRRGGQQIGRLHESRLARLCRTGPVALRREQPQVGLRSRFVHHRCRHLELNGAGPARPHFPEGDARDFGDAVVAEDRSTPFHGRREDAELVLPLKGRNRRRVDDAEAMLRRDRQQRHSLMARGDHAREEVGRARSRIAENRCDLARGLVETDCHVGSRRLVSHRYQADAFVIQCGE